MAPSIAPFTSPLGPLHHAHPSQHGATLRTLFSLLRRHGTPSSAPLSPTKPSPTTSSTSSVLFDCTLVPSDESTYSSLVAVDHSSFSSPPPPYSHSPNGVEENLIVEDITAETAVEKKQRVKAEKLEKKRRELLEADRRMGEVLKSYGL